jgi:HAD superfamily hydrolase (TIGR01509 family)
MIRAILFDFGGTLDTDGIHWSEKFWDIYQRPGIPIAKSDYEKAYIASESILSKEKVDPDCSFLDLLNRQLSLQIGYLAEKNSLTRTGDPMQLAALIARQCYDDVLNFMEKTKIILAALKGEYRLGLVSNFNGNLATVCKELGIFEYFSTIIDSTIVGVSKPDPQIYRIALGQLGVAAKDCAMVGDSYERDIVPAKLLGCMTIWLHGRSWKEPETTDMADFCIHSLLELPTLIGDIGGSH